MMQYMHIYNCVILFLMLALYYISAAKGVIFWETNKLRIIHIIIIYSRTFHTISSVYTKYYTSAVLLQPNFDIEKSHLELSNNSPSFSVTFQTSKDVHRKQKATYWYKYLLISLVLNITGCYIFTYINDKTTIVSFADCNSG